MKLDSLKPLIHHDGPLTTVCLDATRGDESGDREVRNRWNGMRRALEQEGAPAQTLAALEEAVLRPTHVPGRHGRYLVASGSQILMDRVLAEPPVRDEAFHDGAPSLAPAVAAADEAVRYLLVEIDRQGADLVWSDAESHAAGDVHEQVEGGHDELHKFNGGGWAQRRFQMRVQDSWERNAEAVATEVDKLVADLRPELVLVTGDVRAVPLLRDALGHAAKELLVEVPGGSRADGVKEDVFAQRVHEVLEAYRARRREAVADRVREALGRGDGAVTSLDDVVDVLRKGQVDELVVVRNAAGASVARLAERTLWTGPDPLQLGTRRDDVQALGVPADEVRELRADIGMLRAAVAQDAGFTFAMEGSLDLVDGVGALLRWSDAATPHESAPSYTGDTHRRH
ncbi:Vms1/Ankzf1 family peptidyl-tRNA hydrolase [Actinotalea sp. JY-7876]|uniref:baeRF2 domain-containing protein n=1 Tax=Actinotalea sp. JY-7876 TaxID=2758442 RepID=UPI0015F3BA24|nr:Vms1/Ankzf1 family peptidyl-tRNA hydrolase [Actinotalea sp. JY-7876]